MILMASYFGFDRIPADNVPERVDCAAAPSASPFGSAQSYCLEPSEQ